jgi:uncharacterized repeat protein (TIGR01451 family)
MRKLVLVIVLVAASLGLVSVASAADKIKVKEGAFFTLTCPSDTTAAGGTATFYDKNGQPIETQEGWVLSNQVRFGPAPKKTQYAVAQLDCRPVTTTTTSTSTTTTTTVPQPPEADLKAFKLGTGVADIGDTIDYHISVRNDGPDPATNVVVTDQLPPEVQFLGVTSSNMPMDCTHNPDAYTLVCQTEVLQLGQTWEITLQVRTVEVTDWVNRVRAQSDVADPNPFSNEDRVITEYCNPFIC